MNFFGQKDISAAKRDRFYIQKTIEQIQNDFKQHQIKLKINPEEAIHYQMIVARLSELIEQLLEGDISKFFSLLYTIDIPEEKVKQILFTGKNKKASEQMSELIVKRELLKVLTKRHY